MANKDALKSESAVALYEAAQLIRYYSDNLSKMDAVDIHESDWESVYEAAKGIETSVNLMVQGLRDRLYPEVLTND